jgi:hypothetical protein
MDFEVNPGALELSRLIAFARTAEGLGCNTPYLSDHLVLDQLTFSIRRD